MNPGQLDIEIRDTVFDPDVPRADAKVGHTKENDRTSFRVYIYLQGYDLPYIDSVTYTLHETFVRPNRTVRRTQSNPNCKLMIWTWGLFVVKATIVDIKGFSYSLEHNLTYDRELPPAGDKRYVYEDESFFAHS